MLTVLCLILLMTYRRFVLSSLALLNLQFIESPTTNCSQTAAVSFQKHACRTQEHFELLNVAWCTTMMCMWTFTLCLIPITEQTHIIYSEPSKNERETYSCTLEIKSQNHRMFGKSCLCWFSLMSPRNKSGFYSSLVYFSSWGLYAEWNSLCWQWLLGLVRMTECVPIVPAMVQERTYWCSWYLTWHYVKLTCGF